MPLAVPFYCVISCNNEQFVYVEEEGVARKREVPGLGNRGKMDELQVPTAGLQTGG